MTIDLFQRINDWWRRTIGTDRGASMVEYALLVILIAILGFVAVQVAGNTLSDTYHNIAGDLQNANAH